MCANTDWRSVKAFPLEYRFRYILHALIYVLGFWAPWERYGNLSFGGTTAWTALASLMAREHWLGFSDASRLLLIVCTAAAIVAALLRVWGSSYLGPAVVHAGTMQAEKVVADGPYRFVRNPLYLGTIFNSIALSLLMPPSGAVVSLVLITIEQMRLIGAEEAFLGPRLGATYRAYQQVVPRLWPSLQPRTISAEDQPRWLWGLLSEVYVVGTAISFIALGSTYNGTIILKGILVAFGLSLIARALIPAAPVGSATAT